MLSRSVIRRLIISGLFILASLVGWLGTKNPLVFVYGTAGAGLAILIELMVYSRRGIFLFTLVGLIAGFYSGKLVFELFAKIAPAIFLDIVEPYFIMVFTYLGFSMPLLASTRSGASFLAVPGAEGDRKQGDVKILDTSVIIDGRISDIAETGFLSGTLLLPKFVLNEIQALADSKDPIKRSRARRGLEVLNKMKEVPNSDLKITSRDFADIRGVDAKLIALAKEIGGAIVTNDYNLNKVAKLDGIAILNLNDLANALKPVLLPGEDFDLDIIKEGKEPGQGVGYLADGTMVVVAGGSTLIGRHIHVHVTSILQTSAGRIIFTEPKK